VGSCLEKKNQRHEQNLKKKKANEIKEHGRRKKIDM